MLWKYGGVYADLDFECLRPFEPFVDGKGSSALSNQGCFVG